MKPRLLICNFLYVLLICILQIHFCITGIYQLRMKTKFVNSILKLLKCFFFGDAIIQYLIFRKKMELNRILQWNTKNSLLCSLAADWLKVFVGK